VQVRHLESASAVSTERGVGLVDGLLIPADQLSPDIGRLILFNTTINSLFLFVHRQHIFRRDARGLGSNRDVTLSNFDLIASHFAILMRSEVGNGARIEHQVVTQGRNSHPLSLEMTQLLRNEEEHITGHSASLRIKFLI
jgi:hypothetical protein